MSVEVGQVYEEVTAAPNFPRLRLTVTNVISDRWCWVTTTRQWQQRPHRTETLLNPALYRRINDELVEGPGDDVLVPLSEVTNTLREFGGGEHVTYQDGTSSYAMHSVEEQIAELERRFGGAER